MSRTRARSAARGSSRNERSAGGVAMRSAREGGDRMGAAQRGGEQVRHRLLVAQTGALDGGGESRIGREAGVGVDLEDPRPPALVDAEVDARVAVEVEEPPARLCQGRQ